MPVKDKLLIKDSTRYDMDQKLTEEQQRSAHKVIKANRGDCGSIFLPNISCIDCPNSSHNSGVLCFVSNFPESSKSPAFQAENLRRSQAWLDTHITDAEIMAESPREFCERMVRTEGFGRCKGRSFFSDADSCKNCVLFTNTNCSENLSLNRAKAYLASHPATSQEPPKRRPTPEEMVVGAPVRVRLWDELVRDGKLNYHGHIKFPTIYFNNEMRQYCGNTYKIIVGGHSCHLDGCGDWIFIPEMLDYVESEKVVEPKSTAVNFFDWCGKKVIFKDGRNNGAKYTVCSVDRDLDFDGAIHFKTVFFFELLEIKGHSFPAQLFNLCETQDSAKPEPVANAPKPEAKEKVNTTVKGDVDKLPLGLLRLINFRDLLPVDALRIIALEGQVDDLTKKLTASTRKCDRLQRRLRANWEAKRDGEMATREEIIAWFDAGKGTAIINGSASRIRLMSRTDWIPATRGNLKL